MSKKDPRLGRVVISPVEDTKASCGWCGKPLERVYTRSGWLAPYHLERDIYSVPMPQFHHHCTELNMLWATRYGMQQGLRFGWIKKTRKTEKKLHELADSFYKRLVLWRGWFTEAYGKEELRRLEGRSI